MAPTIPSGGGAWVLPRFNLRVEDLSHAGASLFFKHVDPCLCSKKATETVLAWLYTFETAPANVSLITLVLREMPGVAYTTGTISEKEIHISLGYIARSRDPLEREIMGVLTHEMVHCYQYNGKDLAPGGLIEGVADWVRLRAGLGRPGWDKSPGKTWDHGYEKTAYFLDWIERTDSRGGVVPRINECMKDHEYTEMVFVEVTGKTVDKLWELYLESFVKN